MEYLFGPTCHPFGPRESVNTRRRHPPCLTLPQERKKKGPPNKNTLDPRWIEKGPERRSYSIEEYTGLKTGPNPKNDVSNLRREDST